MDVGHNLLINALLQSIISYQDSCHEGPSVGRREKAKTSKDERDEGHEQDLSSTSHTHGQQHRSSWGSEDITVN